MEPPTENLVSAVEELATVVAEIGKIVVTLAYRMDQHDLVERLGKTVEDSRDRMKERGE